MKAPRLSLWITLGLLLAACAPDTTPLSTSASTPPAGPVIASLDATPNQGVMALTLHASDPTSNQLSFSWSADQGQLSATSGPSVLWQPPKAAGTYTVIVKVSDTQGLSATATQQFVVDGSGQAQSTGQATITQPSTAPGQSARSGTFQVFSPIPIAQASFTAVSGVTLAPSPSPIGPQPQVVATPAPGPTQIPTPPPLFLATPQPSPPVLTPAPSPLPTNPPPTPQPGVSLPPVANWVQVPPGSVGTTNGLNGLFMEPPAVAGSASTEGWAVGGAGTIIHTTDSGQTWASVPSGLPFDTFLQVFFASQTNGYILAETELLRTLDGGQTWQTILPVAKTNGRCMAMSVFNAAIITVVMSDGTVMFTQNATTPTASSVGWTTVNTNPAGDPADTATNLTCAGVFPTSSNASVSFAGGNPSLFRNNFAVGGTGAFQRVLFYPQGAISSIGLDSENDLWTGTSDGHMFHTANAEAATPTFTELPQFTNADSNGVQPTFFITTPIESIDFVDANNGWFINGGVIYNTTDGTDPVPRWHSYPIGPALQQLQIEAVVNNGQRSFVGWAIGGNQVFRYGF